jgi:hypothetical protein
MNCRNPWINSTVLEIELVELCHVVYHGSMVIEIYITISACTVRVELLRLQYCSCKNCNFSFSLGICVGDMVN